MLTRLHLTHFKNFASATLHLGPFNLLVGANASGKSNIRDAFRFLHGIGRGYSLPEIFGEKRGDGGELQWSGIRGGKREVALHGSEHFNLELESSKWQYNVIVAPGHNGDFPIVTKEFFTVPEAGIFHSWKENERLNFCFPFAMGEDGYVELQGSTSLLKPAISIYENTIYYHRLGNDQLEVFSDFRQDLASMRFLDFSPEFMRKPSMPGINMLGDRGEYLSSVLQCIKNEPIQQRILLHWLQELTPMDVVDIEFEPDAAGNILLVLVEKSGMRITANSASDGTLRFLGILAAFLGPKPARFYFIEEIETGIHPTRQYLLLDLLEKITTDGRTQIVATTHSPQLLSALSKANRPFASLCYRREEHPDARIIRLVDLPDATRVFNDDLLGTLHATGWFENMASCIDDAENV